MPQSRVTPTPDIPTPPPITLKNGWRSKIGLSGILLGAVLLSVLGGGGAAGFHAFNILYQNKLTDTWAIFFLNLERQSDHLSKSLQEKLIAATAAQPSILLHDLDGKLRTIKGGFPAEISAENLGVSLDETQDQSQIAQFGGQDYLMRSWGETEASQLMGEELPSGEYLALWPLDLHSVLSSPQKKSVSDIYYFATRGGKLLYSNRQDVSAADFAGRPLVQKFISHPLRQGQLEFHREGGQWYGLFHEVPGTNIILFAETSSWMVLSTVRQSGMKFVIGLILILAAVLILMQFPISGVVSPIRELVHLVNEVAKGNFNVQPTRSAFGELSILSHSFSEMGKRLLVRDQNIQDLLVVQEEKIRLQKELSLARSIQANFFIESDLPADAGVEVDSRYIPAKEVGGDWYGYFHNETSGECVFAVADVTGHGAGPALFTAIIASVFEEQIEVARKSPDYFSMLDFSGRVNRLIHNLGRGKINATLQLASFKKGEEEIRLLNAGNPFPWIVSPSELNMPTQIIPMRSDPLGVSNKINVFSKTVHFPKGSILLLFSDGMIEGRADQKLYPEARMKQACEFSSHHTTKQFVDRLFNDWTDYLSGKDPIDDFCMLAVRAL